MAQVFASYAQDVEEGMTYPDLVNLYVPGLDDPNAVDGLGVTTPWGAGATVRASESESGYSAVGNSLVDTVFPLSGGDAITYEISGLVGPQGPQGPPGEPGLVTTIRQQVFVPYGSTPLDVVLQQIRNVWSSDSEVLDDTMIYAKGSITTTEWFRLDVDSDVASWNDVSLDADGSHIVISSDAGVYFSSNSGGQWTHYNPGDLEEAISSVEISAEGDIAVALGKTSGKSGKIWVFDPAEGEWFGVALVGEGAPE